ncbi:methyltransferase domain-containing protein [Thiofilum flexile]|uniref:methyltransferase domain-containing protein n=1 Tax=Thiofilum flexile TaxID=125627 RepID=UPI000362DA53|nr:methyltransferase domain-containing protein [Thiofilum flexile]
MQFKYLLSKEDIIDHITLKEYKYDILDVNILDINIKTLIIKPIINNSLYEMQPIVLESIDTIKYLMEKLWIAQSNNGYYIDEKNISLKNQVVFSKIIESVKYHCPSNLLDVGYANRSFYDFLKKNELNPKYIGVDILDFNYDDFETIQANANALPFDKNSFDLINMSLLLLNSIDPFSIINEAGKALKKNGMLLITDINSKYYKASGVYIKKLDEWEFIKVIETEDIFFTIKTLGRRKFFFHAFHEFNLYRKILESLNFLVLEDKEFGLTEEIIRPIYSKKIIKSFSRDLKYPSFHFLKSQKII